MKVYMNGNAHMTKMAALAINSKNFENLPQSRTRRHMILRLDMKHQRDTSRQRSGKGAIRKRCPLQKPRREKTNLTIRY